MKRGTMALLSRWSRVRRPAWALLGALAVAGCTSSRTRWVESGVGGAGAERRQQTPRAAEEPLPDNFEPRAFLARYPTPEGCEAAARRLQARSPDMAWRALEACVQGTHFTQLGTLLSPAWERELLVRPNAARLLARVVAYRGGNVEADLRRLQDKGLPLFGLEEALAQPQAHRGRYVLLRGRMGDVRGEGDQQTAWLVEQTLGEAAGARSAQPGSLWAEPQAASDAPSAGEAEDTEDTVARVAPFQPNGSRETGREALGRMEGPEASLAPGRDFVILARFDGLRMTSGTGDEAEEADASKLPVLSILGAYKPHPLVTY